MATRQDILKQAQKWLGRNEANGTHKLIIDTYNAHKPLARGYKVKYTDEWCATFVSACAIATGATGIIPTECSCNEMMKLFKKIGSWQEADNYVPQPADVIFYDWEDNGKGNNVGVPNHVGIVESVNNGLITVIEGNKGEAVSYRAMGVNGRYIRGYCLPDYASKATESKTVCIALPVIRKGDKGKAVTTMQRLLTGKGYDTQGIDGSFGAKTEKAVRMFQRTAGITVDGICGYNTWLSLLTK